MRMVIACDIKHDVYDLNSEETSDVNIFKIPLIEYAWMNGALSSNITNM